MASVLTVGLWSGSGAVAGAASTTAAPGTASAGLGTDAASAEAALRIQAQELADQIQAEGVQLDQLAENYDATELRSQQLAGRLQVLGAAMVRTDAQVTAARADLKEQALLAYVAGGAPITASLPGRPGLGSHPHGVLRRDHQRRAAPGGGRLPRRAGHPGRPVEAADGRPPAGRSPP